jgi:hypothetical protein
LEVTQVVAPVRAEILEAISKKTATLEIRLNKIKAFALKSTKHLQQRIDEKLEDEDLDWYNKAVPTRKTLVNVASQDSAQGIHRVLG